MTDQSPDQLPEAVEALTLIRLTPAATFADLPQELRAALTQIQSTPTANFAGLPQELREALTRVRLAPAAEFADLPREIRERVCPSSSIPRAIDILTSRHQGNLANISADLLIHVLLRIPR